MDRQQNKTNKRNNGNKTTETNQKEQETQNNKEKNTIKYILGLDLSTTHVGFAVLRLKDKKIVNIGSINFSSKESFWERLERGSKEITDIYNKYDSVKIYVEKSLEAFAGGFSTAKTIITLSNFNILLRYKLSLNLGINVEEIELIGASSARKTVGIKVDKKLSTSTKDQVLNQVILLIGEEHFPKEIKTRGKHKGVLTYIVSCYDMADAVVIALYAFHKL